MWWREGEGSGGREEEKMEGGGGGWRGSEEFTISRYSGQFQ